MTIDTLGRVLLVTPSEPEPGPDVDSNTVIQNTSRRRSSSTDIKVAEFNKGKPIRVTYDNRYNTTVENDDIYNLMEGQVREMRRSLSHIKANILEKHDIDSRTREIARAWRDVARVLDRFFFIMYVILIVVSLITLFPRPK